MSQSDDALERALAHLGTAGSLLDEQQSLGRVGRMRRPDLTDAAGREVAAAAEHLRGEIERQRARIDLHDDAIARLELVTAGDERLIDDLAAALEALQRDQEWLRRRLDGRSPEDAPDS